jgi:VWFA-related protein
MAEPTGDDDFDAFVQGVHNQFADFQNSERALRTLAALEAIANHVAGLPGRKNLLWLSGGFPFTLGVDPISDIFRERRTFFEEAQRAARAVSDAGVAIYPVDVRTRLTPVAVQDALKSSASPNAIRRGRPITPLDQNLDTLEHLADQTGGRAFINTNNFRAAITQAVQDAQVTYTLGFYPDGEPDGKFHELKVSVDRHGLNVRHRKGYLALADMPPSPAAWKAQVDHARVSPIPSQQIECSQSGQLPVAGASRRPRSSAGAEAGRLDG